MASSSSSSIILESKYDVFLSFRGEDTRDNFTSHLYSALCRKQIAAFIDDDALERGEEISAALLEAIQESMISIIIFSKDYASSRWCLDELLKIIECKEMNGQIVVPVFYGVKQTGSFGHAFAKLEERFKEMTEKVQKWRDALTEAAHLSGWDSMKIRPDSKLVDEIVRDILEKLDNKSPSNHIEGLVGMDSRVEHIKSLLCIGFLDFQVLGIWGMGGIGKTTLAEVIFNQVSGQFESCCFIADVRERSEKYGLVHLREQLLSKVLEEEIHNIGSLNTIPISIKRRVQRKRVFIVLDDVNHPEQLKILTEGLAGFGLGSRVIITTRDKQVLCAYGVDNMYEAKELNYDQSFQLFCNHAFKKNPPLEDLVIFSKRVIDFAKGNPLALKVLGSSLCGKDRQEWESAMDDLRMIDDPQIYNLLTISYNGLNVKAKNIFLDIACFFKGENRDYVTKILDGCYKFSIHYWLSVLIDKSIITISTHNNVEMHDLLQQMGHKIVFQESEKEPSKRSRLWWHEDVYNVLKYNKGTDLIEGIFLDMSKIRDIRLSPQAFENMSRLKLLKFYTAHIDKDVMDISKVQLPQGLNYHSDELRYLYWYGYPLKTLPSNFSPENLIEIDLPYSNLEQLSVKIKHDSDFMVHSSDPQLEHCKSLIDAPTSMQYLTNLRILNLSGCESFRDFPSNIHFTSPITINLSYCINLTKFPQISGSIKELNLRQTAIEEIPSSIECLTALLDLNMRECPLQVISTAICRLKSLHSLNLSSYLKLEIFPEIKEKMEFLRYLNLDETAIKDLPSSIEHLNGLSWLSMRFCKNLQTIPSSIGNLTSLIQIDLFGCSKFDKLPENLENLKCLDEFDVNETVVSQLPSSIACWKQIRYLSLAFCSLMEIPKYICCLSSLEYLDLQRNNFQSLPTCLKQLSMLTILDLSECNMLQSLPKLPVRLEYLNAMYCKHLQSLPEPPSSLEDLKLYANKGIFIMYTGCLKLNQKAYNNILLYLLKFCYEKVSNRISLCLPGSEIPEWFSHQSLGSSITIELPQHGCNRKLIGFALCTVIAFEKRYFEQGIAVECNGRSKINFYWNCFFTPGKVLINSDHIALGYIPSADVKDDCATISFEFYLKTSLARMICQKGCKVKCCGVCPLYKQLNMTNSSIERFCGNTFKQIMLERKFLDANTSQTENCTPNEEEVEPHPKRICKKETDASSSF